MTRLAYGLLAYGLLALLIFGLTGCGAKQRVMAGLTGYSKICVEGVTYLQFPSGVTPQWTRDAKLVPCQ